LFAPGQPEAQIIDSKSLLMADDSFLVVDMSEQILCSSSDQMPQFFISFAEVDQLGVYSGFQLSEQISTADDAKGRGGWLIVLKRCVPLRSLRLAILFNQAKYAVSCGNAKFGAQEFVRHKYGYSAECLRNRRLRQKI
jgi:hypothetical protein